MKMRQECQELKRRLLRLIETDELVKTGNISIHIETLKKSDNAQDKAVLGLLEAYLALPRKYYEAQVVTTISQPMDTYARSPEEAIDHFDRYRKYYEAPWDGTTQTRVKNFSVAEDKDSEKSKRLKGVHLREK